MNWKVGWNSADVSGASQSSLSTTEPGAGWTVAVVTCAPSPVCPRGASVRLKWPISRRQLPLGLSALSPSATRTIRLLWKMPPNWLIDWQSIIDSVLDFFFPDWLDFYYFTVFLLRHQYFRIVAGSHSNFGFSNWTLETLELRNANSVWLLDVKDHQHNSCSWFSHCQLNLLCFWGAIGLANNWGYSYHIQISEER